MNNNEYLDKLEAELKKHRVKEPGPILEEYRTYFARKEADAYSYEDAVARLEDPEIIAKQYTSEHKRRSKGPSTLVVIGLIFADFFALCFFLFLFAWAVIFGVLAAALAVCGICHIFGASIEGFLPPLPMVESLLLGVATIALTVLCAIICAYCWIYALHLLKVYIRWNQNMFSCKYAPPSPKYPKLSAKTRRKLRDTSLFSATIFASFFAAAIVLLMLRTKTVFFWHVLNI